MTPSTRRSHAHLTAVAGTVSALLFAAMAMHAAPLEPSVPRIQFCFTEACFRAVLAQWQPSGVKRFTWHFAIDFPFLVSYGVFGYALYRYGFHESKLSMQARTKLSWTLPLAAVMDAVENLLHLGFLYAAGLPAALYFVAGAAATAKWGLIAGFTLATAYHGIRRVR